MSNSIKIQWSEIIKRVQFKLKYHMAKERIHIYVLGKARVPHGQENKAKTLSTKRYSI
jgi:hypothetical protein